MDFVEIMFIVIGSLCGIAILFAFVVAAFEKNTKEFKIMKTRNRILNSRSFWLKRRHSLFGIHYWNGVSTHGSLEIFDSHHDAEMFAIKTVQEENHKNYVGSNKIVIEEVKQFKL
jgi:hypothetical protein